MGYTFLIGICHVCSNFVNLSHNILAMKKQEQYQILLEQLKALIDGETCTVSILANTAALLHEAMGERFFWTGFYLVNDGELVLGPFQGPVACYRIKRGRGVCGTSWECDETLVVPDVEQFAGHIACSSLSRSEIVVPLHDSKGTVTGVLDIDSRELNAFDDVDREYLEQVVQILSSHLF